MLRRYERHQFKMKRIIVMVLLLAIISSHIQASNLVLFSDSQAKAETGEGPSAISGSAITVVSGTVREAGSAQAISGAAITVSGYESFYEQSNSAGYYLVEGVDQAHEYTITAALEGYGPLTKSVVFGADNDFLLKRIDSGLSFSNSNPVITFETGGTKFLNSPAGGNGTGEITYEITDGEDIAVIDRVSGEVTVQKPGVITVKATREEDELYCSISASYTLTVDKGHISDFMFEKQNPESIPYIKGGTYINKASSALSEGKVTYSISYGDAATIDMETGQLSLVKTGTVGIIATIEEDDLYQSGTAYYNITIGHGVQEALVFQDPLPLNITYRDGGTYLNTAIGGSGTGSIGYNIVQGDAAWIEYSTGVLMIMKAGTVKVKATKASDDCYMETSAEYTITIDKAEQTGFAFENPDPGDVGVLTTRFQNRAVGGQSHGNIQYRILKGAEYASIDQHSGELRLYFPGEVVVQATKSGDDRYLDVSETYTITIGKSEQANFRFEISNPSNLSYQEGLTYTNPVTGKWTQKDAVFTIISGEEVADIDSYTGKLSVKKAGAVEVQAFAEGDAWSKSATATYTIIIDKGIQTDFGFSPFDPRSISYDPDKEYIYTASGGQSNKEISYQITEGLEIATVDAERGALTIEKAGIIVIEATLAGDECYEPVTASIMVWIQKAEQTGFVFGNMNPDNIVYDPVDNTFINTAFGGQSGLEVSYELIDGEAVTLDEETGVLTIIKAGEVTIRANLLGDDCYLPASVTYTLTIDKADQTDFYFEVTEPERVIYNDNGNIFMNLAGGGQSEQDITYRIVDGNAALVNTETGVLTILRAGSVMVKATLAGDERYNPVSVTYSLTIERDDQTLVFNEIGLEEEPILLYYGNNYINQANEVVNEEAADGYGYGTAEIRYSVVSDPEGVVLGISEDGDIIFNNNRVGDVAIKATKAEDDCYNMSETVYYLRVEYLEVPEEPYIISGETRNDLGWYTSDVTITAKPGHELSYINDLTDNMWTESLVVDQEGSNGKVIYLRRASALGFDITDAINIDGIDLQIDKSIPASLEVSYSQSIRDLILETITFGIYQSSVTVVLTSEDRVSGIESFEWKYSQQPGSSDVNKAIIIEGVIDSSEIIYEGDKATATFKLTADEAQQYRGSLHFMVTDKAGWSIEKYDENVIIVDSIAPMMNIYYEGKLARKVNYSNGTVTSVDADTRFIYSSNIDVTIEIEEANFFDSTTKDMDDVRILVKRDGNAITDYTISDWTRDTDTDLYRRKLTLDKDGDYSIEVEYMDKSNNQMQYSSPSEDSKGLYKYTSHIMTKDTIAPTISVVFDITNDDNSSYYNKSRTATVQVSELNFNTVDATISISAKDLYGEDIQSSSAEHRGSQSGWTLVSKGIWQTTLLFEADAIYSLSISCKDIANNMALEYDQGKFVVDRTSPLLSDMKVDYSVPVVERVLENITFGFYNPSLTVRIEAIDVISGIKTFSWNYNQEADTSTSKNVSRQEEIITSDKIEFDTVGARAVASFTLTADESKQYRGNISFKATDMANNTSESFVDSKIVVADSIAPTRIVELSKAQQVVDTSSLLTKEDYDYTLEQTNSTLYYNGEVTAILKITEANFIVEDVIIHVNDEKLTSNQWTQEGDEWTCKISLSGDGDYIITASYIDASANEMVMYQSEKIVIDSVKPTIKVSYGPDHVIKELDGRKYYDEEQLATITIHEHNFRADDVIANIVAKDVQGNEVATIDYGAYLKERSNWMKNGDAYSATIRYDKDANYSFDISYIDLARNLAAEYDTDLFTVDTTNPTDLSISFSESIYETILNAVTFGYYKDRMTVTISAEDQTSGIDRFQYSYIRSEGVSDVNAELLEAAINDAEITYLDNGKKAVATFSIPDKVLDQRNQFNGTVMFIARDQSGNGSEKDRRDRIIVDNIAPTATISFNEPADSMNNISYYANEVNSVITITEANFNKDDVIVTISKDGQNPYTVNPVWNSNDVNVHKGSIQIAEDGDYTITVIYTDRSDNKMTTYQSNQMTIDTVLPVVQVDKIAHKTAYNDEVIGFVITAQDTNFEPQSFKPILECVLKDEDGKFVKQELELPQVDVIANKQEYTYSIDNLTLDGIYTLNCMVRDKAGNTTDRMIIRNSDNEEMDHLTFSVNRQGSTYTLDESTYALVSSYYIKEVQEDIILEEVNVDELESYQIALNNTILTEGSDYKVRLLGGNGDWHNYSYIINETLFEDEGEYSLVLHSKDRAKNEAYSDIRNAEISFVVDRTAPTLSISGMEQGGRYQVENQKAIVIPKDDGGKLNSLKVVITNKDGKPIRDEAGNDVSVRVDLTGEELLKVMEDNLNMIPFEIPNGLDLTVQVTSTDSAFDSEGNSNLTLVEVNNITVSPDWYIIFYANKPLFYGTLAGFAVSIGLITGLTMIRKRKRKVAHL